MGSDHHGQSRMLQPADDGQQQVRAIRAQAALVQQDFRLHGQPHEPEAGPPQIGDGNVGQVGPQLRGLEAGGVAQPVGQVHPMAQHRQPIRWRHGLRARAEDQGQRAEQQQAADHGVRETGAA